MSLTPQFKLRNFARGSALIVRRHAPGLFFSIASNRLLRAVYRRLANPARAIAPPVYINSPPPYISLPSETAPSVDDNEPINNSTEMLTRLCSELAAWKPGKRIDA